MVNEYIPWHIFLEALHKQPKAELDEWLAKWSFGEQGAFLLSAPAKPEDDQRRRLKNAFVDFIFHHPMSHQTIH